MIFKGLSRFHAYFGVTSFSLLEWCHPDKYHAAGILTSWLDFSVFSLRKLANFRTGEGIVLVHRGLAWRPF